MFMNNYKLKKSQSVGASSKMMLSNQQSLWFPTGKMYILLMLLCFWTYGCVFQFYGCVQWLVDVVWTSGPPYMSVGLDFFSFLYHLQIKSHSCDCFMVNRLNFYSSFPVIQTDHSKRFTVPCFTHHIRNMGSTALPKDTPTGEIWKWTYNLPTARGQLSHILQLPKHEQLSFFSRDSSHNKSNSQQDSIYPRNLHLHGVINWVMLEFRPGIGCIRVNYFMQRSRVQQREVGCKRSRKTREGKGLDGGFKGSHVPCLLCHWESVRKRQTERLLVVAVLMIPDWLHRAASDHTSTHPHPRSMFCSY